MLTAVSINIRILKFEKRGDPKSDTEYDMTYSQRGYCTSKVLDSYYGAVQFEAGYSLALLSSKLPQTNTKVVPRLNHDCFHLIFFQVIFHEESQPLYGLIYRQRGTIHHKDTSCIFPNFKNGDG